MISINLISRSEYRPPSMIVPNTILLSSAFIGIVVFFDFVLFTSSQNMTSFVLLAAFYPLCVFFFSILAQFFLLYLCVKAYTKYVEEYSQPTEQTSWIARTFIDFINIIGHEFCEVRNCIKLGVILFGIISAIGNSIVFVPVLRHDTIYIVFHFIGSLNTAIIIQLLILGTIIFANRTE